MTPTRSEAARILASLRKSRGGNPKPAVQYQPKPTVCKKCGTMCDSARQAAKHCSNQGNS